MPDRIATGSPARPRLGHAFDVCRTVLTDIIDACAEVSQAANGRSLFRINRLIWQIAEDIYRHGTIQLLPWKTPMWIFAGALT